MQIVVGDHWHVTVEVAGGVMGQHRDQTVLHRDVDRAPDVRRTAGVKRCQNPVRGEHPGADVADRHAPLGRLADRAGERHDPARSLHDLVVARPRPQPCPKPVIEQTIRPGLRLRS